jgi:hypothetical protein
MKYKRLEPDCAAVFAAFTFELADDIDSLSFDFFFNFFETRPSRLVARQMTQTSLIFRSIVLMTESILPFSTCLATLNVKPFTV